MIYLRCKGSFFGYFGTYTVQFITNKVLYQLDILKILTVKKSKSFQGLGIIGYTASYSILN